MVTYKLKYFNYVEKVKNYYDVFPDSEIIWEETYEWNYYFQTDVEHPQDYAIFWIPEIELGPFLIIMGEPDESEIWNQ